MAYVSLEALQKVKTALSGFATESNLILNDLCIKAHSSITNCSQSLNALVCQVDNLQALVNKQKQQVQLRKQQIVSLSCEIRQLQETLSQLVMQMDAVRQKIASYHKTLTILHRQLAAATDEDEKEALEREIANTEQNLRMTQQREDELERQHSEIKRTLSDMRAQLVEVKSTLSQTESSLQANEHELRHLTDKLERLKVAYASAQANVETLIRSAKKLQGDSTMPSSMSCVDSCIASLDEYLNVNF